MEQRACTSCGLTLPCDREHFEWQSDCQSFRTQCRECRNKQARDRHVWKKPRRYDLEAGTRTCSKCERTLLATHEFFGAKKSPDGCSSLCKECTKKRNHEYYQAHREEIIAAQMVYDREHAEQQRNYRRQWKRDNPVRVKALNRQWYEDNYERCRELAWNYRARKRGASGSHTTADIKAQHERQEGKCYWCNCKVGDKYHVDHVVPLSKGGSNWPSNIVIACPTCNQVKKDKHPMDFAGQLC